MAAAAMTSLPPTSTTTKGWWPTARHCRCRRCCRHHALVLAFAITITAAFANGIAPPMLLLMVGCCVVCRPLPAALSAVQICQPPRPVVDDDGCYCRCQQLLSPLPQLTTTASKTQRLLFVVNGSDDNHRRLQRQLMEGVAMTSLPPLSTMTTGWWPTANAAATTPLPLPPPSPSLQPLPTSSSLRRICLWLVVELSVAPCLMRCLPSKFVSPPPSCGC